MKKVFHLRYLSLLMLAFGVWAVYYYLSSRQAQTSNDEGSVEEGFVPSLLHDVVMAKGAAMRPVEMDVYYESLCPDSRSFFLKELLPSMLKLSKHMSVNLIPYGRAETIIGEGTIEFKCQHGAPECLGNKIHACVIQNTLHNNVLSVNVTSCLFEEYFQSSSSETCCEKFKVSWDQVKRCAYGVEGSRLLKTYGDMTNSQLPIDFIPAVAINKSRGSKSYQAALLKNLKREVCNILKKVYGST